MNLTLLIIGLPGIVIELTVFMVWAVATPSKDAKVWWNSMTPKEQEWVILTHVMPER